ncbi:MAG: MATE family efflux transporter [Armatimonadetes bacterium]|nr:MAG: MATE family efflux transporter [Armatimonadota bacterium]
MWREFRQAFRRNPRDRVIAALAIPALGTLAIDPVVTIVDTAWVSRLGTSPLAALAIAGAVFAAVFSVFNFVQVTITPLIAGEIARGNRDKAGQIATGSVWIAVGLGIGLGVIFVLLAPAITDLFRPEPDVAADAIAYLRIRFLALPFLLIATVGHGVYRGHQDTRTPLYVAIGMNVINLILDPILIFGLDLGVAGAAWATVIAQAVAAAWFLLLMFGTQKAVLGIGSLRGRIGSLPIGEVLSAGWPMIVRSMALLGAVTATTFAASRIGTDETAAHQVAMQVWLFLAFVLDSYAIAAQAMVGTDFGINDIVGARKLSNRLLALGLVTGIGLSVILAVTAPLIPALFDLEPSVRALLSQVYIFVIVLQPVTALVYVWDGIGIGASAFGYLAASMVAAGVATVVTLILFGDTLVGVWASVAVLTGVRFVALAGWHQLGPLSSGRDPSPSSQVA